MKKNRIAKKASVAVAVAALTLSCLNTGIGAYAAETGDTATTVTSKGDVGTSVGIGTAHATKDWTTTTGGPAQSLVKFSDGTSHAFDVPSVKDRCSLRYYGVDKPEKNGPGVKIYGYRIIESNYNQYGFIGWTETKQAADYGVALKSFQNTDENVVQVVIKDTNKDSPYYNENRIITSADITNLASKIISDENAAKTFEAAGQRVELTWNEENNCYMAKDAKPGSYVVIVEQEEHGRIYNPVIISNDYADANVSVSLANFVPDTDGDAERANHDSDLWNAKAFPYEAGVDWSNADGTSENGGNGKFVGYGTVHPTDVYSLVTGENRNLSPQEQKDYLNSRESVTYNRDTQLNGNVFTIDHSHSDKDVNVSHDGDKNGKYAGIIMGDENNIETMALMGQAYAKKSTIGIEKNIRKASVPKAYANGDATLATAGYSKYEDVSEGDKITFDIFTEVPYYAEGYFKDEQKFLFKITDTQHEGLAKVDTANIHVWAGKVDLTDAQSIGNYFNPVGKSAKEELSKDFYTITPAKDGNQFSIEFTKDWCLKNPGAKILVSYDTEVTDEAALGLNGNRNEVFLEYTTARTSPDNDNKPSRGYKFDFAITYTFTTTPFKVAENGAISTADDATGVVTVEDQEDLAKELKVDRPLAGATFMLQRVGSNYDADGLTATKTDITPRDKKLDNVSIVTEKNQTSINLITEDANADANEHKFYYNGYETWFMISDENGLLKFSDTEGNESTYNGIDEGIYTLQEIQAPKDYTINEKIYAININPHYDENVQRFIGTDVQVMDTILDEEGNITSYVTKTGTDGQPTMTFVTGTNYDYDAYGKLIQTYTDTQWVSKESDVYDGKIANLENPDTDQHITTISWDETDTDATKKNISADAIGIVNTKLTRLPSTGGIGTFLYTIGGFAAALAGVFIINKKKDESDS